MTVRVINCLAVHPTKPYIASPGPFFVCIYFDTLCGFENRPQVFELVEEMPDIIAGTFLPVRM